MRRRDIAGVLVASVGVGAVAKTAQAQTCTPSCYPITADEQALDITPVDYSYAPGNARRYLIGDPKTVGGNARAAIQTAINVMIRAGGGVVYIPKGEYLIVPESGWSKVGLVVPYSGNQFGYKKRITLKGDGRDTVLVAGGNEMTVIRWSDSHGRIDGLAIDSRREDGTRMSNVTGLALIASTQSDQIDHNCISRVDIQNCDEGIILQSPPEAGCYYNRFEHCTLNENRRHIWLQDNQSSGGANRNVFIAITISGGNTGIWIDGADTTRLIACSFEDILIDNYPSVQPTAVHITERGSLSGNYFTLDTNLIACTFEDCTRDLNCNNRRTSVIGGNCGVTGAVTGSARPDMLLGGDAQYQLRELHLGGETDGLLVQPNQVAFTPYAQIAASADRASGYPFNADGHLILQSRKGVENDVVFVTGSPLQARVRITGSGQLNPVMDGGATLGSAGARWNEIFAINGVISTSDARDKVVHGALSRNEINAARRIAGLTTMFQWKEAVSDKGDAARMHCGVLAQSVRDAFAAEGLDPDRYAMNCTDEIIDAEGNRSVRYSLRYAELATFVMAAQEQRLAALEAAV